MPASSKSKLRRRAHEKRTDPANILPLILCGHCGGAVIRGQNVGPLFSAKLIKWTEHPVLSKPPMIRGWIPVDGSPGRGDLSLGDQLRQRAAMGGDKERADLAAFEELMIKWIADVVVADIEKEAAANGVDVRTWLTRQGGKDEP
jgi:hypothetical protein